MLKIKIVHKGLVLVAIPLVFGIAFISLLLCGLSDTDRLVQRELKLKDAMISHLIVLHSSAAARMCAICFMASHDDYFKERFRSSKKKAIESYEHLEKLLKNEHSVQIPPLQLSRQQLLTLPPPLRKSLFYAQLEGLAERQTKAALSAMNYLQVLLLAGIVASGAITIALAVFFCLNITNRLLIIMNNTVRLSKGASLGTPLEGNDEIAELDQFLIKSAAEIKELERFKQEMIGVVSHELKSPLSSVGGFLSSLSAGVYGELKPKAKDKIERVNSSVKRLMGLVRELLFLDRLELQLETEDSSVAEIISTSVDTVKELSEQSGVEIVIAKNDAGRIFVDKNRLVQVIVNLLSNAMKFSPPEGTVTVETRQNDGWFECRISDQGRGIPEEFRKQIFEPFKQVDAKDATAKKGTGLGLTISKSIVEQHGGLIGVDSELGRGSTFWFKIPSSASLRERSIEDSVRRDLPSPLNVGSIQKNTGKTGRMRKFKVLQQGLVIIAIPLVFQIAFAIVIGCLLNQVHDQINREESSKEVLNTLNRMAQVITESSYNGYMYAFTKNPSFKKPWEDSKTSTFRLLDDARKLSADDSAEIKDLDEIKNALSKFASMLDFEATNGDNDSQMQELLHRIQNSGRGQVPNIVDSLGGPVSVAQMSSKMTESMSLLRPFLEASVAQDRLMERQTLIGRKLSKDRSQMISTLEITLCVGILLNIGLSVFLALTLMRSLSGRLQHVMENTARMVKRDALDPPIAGGDEIAHLDQILFETGNRLVELETFKRQLISIVSHELRTPLLSISLALEMLALGSWGELSAKGNDRLKIAKDESDRLIRLINDLLDIEKMEAGKFVLDKSEFKVDDLIRTSVDSVGQLAEVKQIKFEFLALDSTLYADRDRLCQVLINLLSNAIKFSPESGVIKIKIEINDPLIEFRVTDQGRGIPEELRNSIFERFVQVERSDASEKGGSGLGLAICKAIVEQHGGTIGVESIIGKGSTFWFSVPLR